MDYRLYLYSLYQDFIKAFIDLNDIDDDYDDEIELKIYTRSVK